MVDRSTRCISEVFGFLKDAEYCELCEPIADRIGQERDQNSNTQTLVTRSVSDTKICQSEPKVTPVVRKCPCHLKRESNSKCSKCPENTQELSLEATTQDRENENCALELDEANTSSSCNGTIEGNEVDEVSEAVTKSVTSCHNDQSESEFDTNNSTNEMQVLSAIVGEVSDVSEVEEESVEFRPKNNVGKVKDRSQTQVVSDIFRFLNSESLCLGENNSDILEQCTNIENTAIHSSDEALPDNSVVSSEIHSTDNKPNHGANSSEAETADGCTNEGPKNPFSPQNRTDEEPTLLCEDSATVDTFDTHTSTDNVQNKNISIPTCPVFKEENVVNTVVIESLLDASNFVSNVKEETTDHTTLVTKTACELTEENKVSSVKDTNDSSTEHILLPNRPVCDLPVCSDKKSETHGETAVLRRRQISQKSETDDHSDDTSDEDSGIYAESFRNSKWIRVDENGDLSLPAGKASSLLSSKNSDESVDVRASSASMSDDVFMENRGPSMPERTHKRSDSSTTTLSETEFKRQYTSRRKCLIQREDSQQEYHRFSARFYDQEKILIIQRDSPSQDFGLHFLDCQPAYITSVDPDSPALKAGAQEGQILIAVNGVNILEASHSEIVTLMQQNPLIIKLEVAYSDFQPVRDLQAIIMSGCMYKLGNSSFMKTWKKRYFVLRQDNCLYYYKNEQEQIPLGAVPLAGYSITRYIDTNKDYCFKADKFGARSYYFMTDTREEMTQWVGKLTEASARSKKRKDSWLDVSSHNVGLPALEIRRPESTGYLNKMGRQRRVWKKRYCVLKNACIYYYKLMTSYSAQGVAHLHGYTVDVKGLPGKRHSFILHPPEPGMRTFYFCAENETDKARWADAMRRSIQRWVKVDTTPVKK